MPPEDDLSGQCGEQMLLRCRRLRGKLQLEALCTGTTNFRVSDWTKSEQRDKNKKLSEPILGYCDDVPVSLPAEC